MPEPHPAQPELQPMADVKPAPVTRRRVYLGRLRHRLPPLWVLLVTGGVLIVALGALGRLVLGTTPPPHITVTTVHATNGLSEFNVPAAAVGTVGQSFVVYVDVSGIVIRQPVVVTATTGGTDVVSAGLSDGAQVVVTSDQPLQDGQSVQLTP